MHVYESDFEKLKNMVTAAIQNGWADDMHVENKLAIRSEIDARIVVDDWGLCEKSIRVIGTHGKIAGHRIIEWLIDQIHKKYASTFDPRT